MPDDGSVLLNGVEFSEVSVLELEEHLTALGATMGPQASEPREVTEQGLKVAAVMLPDTITEPELPLEELAARYRDVAFTWDGKVLLEKELPLDLAKEIKAQKFESIRVEGEAGRDMKGALGSREVTSTAEFWGNDDRKIVSDSAVANSLNHRTTIHMHPNKGPANPPCTAVAVGWRTMITAAHCLAEWGRMPTDVWFTPAAKGKTFPSGIPQGPYGSFTLTGSRCTIHIPAAYLADIDRADNYYDYATITCLDVPKAIRDTGWSGYWANPPQGEQTMSLYGYPGSGHWGGGHFHCPNVTTWPYLCGMSGKGDVWDSRVESNKIDSGPGQSGGPWRRADGYVIGTHVGYYEYFDFGRCGLSRCKRNTGRLLDTGYYNFVKGKSPDWN